MDVSHLGIDGLHTLIREDVVDGPRGEDVEGEGEGEGGGLGGQPDPRSFRPPPRPPLELPLEDASTTGSQR
jgi:hypothetical protein